VDHSLHTREVILHILKDNLVVAQNRMKQQENQQENQHFLERYSIERIMCFFSFNPITKTSLKDKTPNKLASNFCGLC
jgi:hypothetical protein